MPTSNAATNTARVIKEHKTEYVIRTEGGTEYTAVVRGGFHMQGGGKEFPKVGDYVVFTELPEGEAVIEELLPRRTRMVRKSVSSNEPQVLAANIDVVFVVMGLDGDFNLRRLERYLVLAQESGIRPVIVLNKMDAGTDVASRVADAKALAGAVPVLAVSALRRENMESLLSYFSPETTAVLLGSSGAGKSTITNWFLGHEAQRTQEVREDDARGRHTTTHRELFALPTGGYLIDTPGMRELGMYDPDEIEAGVFEDIEELIPECRFPNCDHDKSAGCAVKKAVEEGRIDADHLASYLKLKKEKDAQRERAEDVFFRRNRRKPDGKK